MTERKTLSVCAWFSDKFGLDVGSLISLFIAAILGLSSKIFFYHILYLLKPNSY